MFWFLGILLVVLLGLWVWTRRRAWVFPTAIVAIAFLALWFNFPWVVTTVLIAAVVVGAILALFATIAIAATVMTVGVVVALVAGLLSVGGNFAWNQPDAHPVDLKNPVAVAQLCGNGDGDSGHKAAVAVSKAADSKDDSAERKSLKNWGLDPANTDEINKAKATIDARTKVQCDANGNPVELSAAQLEAAKICLSADEQKALTPGPDANDKILAGCRVIGKAKFDGLSPENKGDVNNKNSYAYYAKDLAETKDVTVARYDTVLLTKAKEENDKGVKSDNPDLAKQILAAFPGVTQADVKIGTAGANPVDFNAHTIEKGGQVFLSGADRFLRTKEDIAAFFAENSDAARAAKDHVTKAIKAAGYGDKEVARAMNGTGYIPIQMKEASQILGTSYFNNGQVKILDEWRESLPGDIYWLFVTEDDKFIPEATVRGDCGNPDMKMIRVVREDTPAAVGVSHGPGEEVCVDAGKVVTSTGECLPPAQPECTSNCAHGPPPCTVNCGGTPPCTENCGGTPPCTVNCGGTPPCTENCGGTPPCTVNCGGTPPCTVNCGGTPKSDDAIDYQRPGTDGTTDSGTGVKPLVPADPQPDQAPPPVVTTQTGGGGVVDTPDTTPGTQTGGSAPGAAAPEPVRSSPPAAEPGVNGPPPANPAPGAPAEGGNSGTITNPFG